MLNPHVSPTVGCGSTDGHRNLGEATRLDADRKIWPTPFITTNAAADVTPSGVKRGGVQAFVSH